MATVNLGSIKFNWQGAYNGATAYAVDDVVSSSGSSYVCIAATTGNAPPNATYWELMSQAGTDGTDLTTTLTTQGDLVYYNGSALARLGAGTAGQALITNGTGANPSWGSAGGIKQVIQNVDTGQETISSSTYTATNITATITPTSASNKILIMANSSAYSTSTASQTYTTIYRGSTNLSSDVSLNNWHNTGGELIAPMSMVFLDSPNTTSATTYTVYAKATAGDIRLTTQGDVSTITLMEVTV